MDKTVELYTKALEIITNEQERIAVAKLIGEIIAKGSYEHLLDALAAANSEQNFALISALGSILDRMKNGAML